MYIHACTCCIRIHCTCTCCIRIHCTCTCCIRIHCTCTCCIRIHCTCTCCIRIHCTCTCCIRIHCTCTCCIRIHKAKNEAILLNLLAMYIHCIRIYVDSLLKVHVHTCMCTYVEDLKHANIHPIHTYMHNINAHIIRMYTQCHVHCTLCISIPSTEWLLRSPCSLEYTCSSAQDATG